MDLLLDWRVSSRDRRPQTSTGARHVSEDRDCSDYKQQFRCQPYMIPRETRAPRFSYPALIVMGFTIDVV